MDTLDKSNDRPSKCFVVMPFGIKPFGDGSGRNYDFDKIYRVIIKRAIQQAGMEPVRADEGVGSKIIHTEMFKDLRDQAVVLADLSLNNPNVFYELGIRHVMASAGTVLMCQKGASLPFDVRLSRCIFYKYDGQSLDWEEAERIVEQLQIALQQAKRGEPDSPVHALLESVVREDQLLAKGQILISTSEHRQDNLEIYQQIIATYWKESNYSIEELSSQHGTTIFGARTLGIYCLREKPLPSRTSQIARQLYEIEQYNLANELYERLREEKRCDYFDLLTYASSYSEAHENIYGSNKAIEIIFEARDWIKNKFNLPDINSSLDIIDDSFSKELAKVRAEYFHFLAAQLRWKAILTKDETDFDEAIRTEEVGIKYMAEARAKGAFGRAGYLSRSYLQTMLMLRKKEGNIERFDAEGYYESILQLKPLAIDPPVDISFLNWYQAIALADAGEGETARRKAIITYAEDVKLMGQSDYSEVGNLEIGKRQYVMIRRFIERYSSVLRHPSLIGSISQILQVEHK
jgi:hypothetical protein